MSVELKVVGHSGTAGTVYATLDDMVSLGPLRDVLNQAGSLRFGLHNLDPLLPEVKAIEREVQVWLDGSFVAGGGWLVPVAPEATIDGSNDVTEFECRGLLWYLDHRFVGRADRLNKVSNASFESATLPPWTATATTATVSTTAKITGTKSARLVQAAAGVDAYISQPVTIVAGGVGELVTLAGWFLVSATGWVGPALEDRGLFLSMTIGGVLRQVAVETIDAETPRGAWQRREVTVWIPPTLTAVIDPRLYSPGGTIYWDEISLTLMESQSYYATDQASIGAGLVAHLQDAAYGKSALAIATSAATTGVVRDRHYQHADHANGGQALGEFANLSDGFDQSIELTATARTWTSFYPRKGTARTAVAWTELTRMRWVPVEGDQAASSIVTLGDGDGPDREEGYADDPTKFGGVTLEDVIVAEAGTPIDALDSRAGEELRVRSTAARLEITFGPGLRIGSMLTGDTFAGPATLHGAVDISGNWRVMETSLDLVIRCLTVSCERV